MQNSERQDIYARITDHIVAFLEQGVRPWMKPWNAEHAAGRITPRQENRDRIITIAKLVRKMDPRRQQSKIL